MSALYVYAAASCTPLVKDCSFRMECFARRQFETKYSDGPREGTVVVEDIYASEHPERAAYQDRWEILRDASHVRTLPLTELLQLFRDQGLETDAVRPQMTYNPRWNAGWLPPGLPHTRR